MIRDTSYRSGLAETVRRTAVIAALTSAAAASLAQATPSTVEGIVQSDPHLAALDRSLNDVVAQAAGHAVLLSEKQLAWSAGRTVCLTSADPRGCLADRYAGRIATVQADAGLVDHQPLIRIRCAGDPPLAFTLTFFHTEPGTLVVERRGQQITMIQQPMASGIRYTANGAEYAEHQGAGRLIWPGQSKLLSCDPGR